MIDDARCFLGPPPPPHQSSHWPRIDDIFHHIKQLAPTYITTIQDDVIISVPSELKMILDEDWQEKFNFRFHIPQSKSRWQDKLRHLFR